MKLSSMMPFCMPLYAVKYVEKCVCWGGGGISGRNTIKRPMTFPFNHEGNLKIFKHGYL